MTKVEEMQVYNICIHAVSGMFADLCNAKNRGINFRWESFANMMQQKAKEFLIVAGYFTQKRLQLAEETCYRKAEELVKRAGFIGENNDVN